MLQPATISFLKQLEKNNNKPWFDANRDKYEAAKEDFELFIEGLLKKLIPLEPAFAELQAKKCIFRIYRDVRFSKDKTPYKSHFSAVFSAKGKKDTSGYYLHLQPGRTFLGGGVWMPQGDALKAIRQELDYNFGDFKKITGNATFKKLFEKLDESDKLKKMPQGYADDNAAAEYLKLKSYTVGHKIADEKALTDKTFTTTCVKTFTAMKPMIDFLNKAMD